MRRFLPLLLLPVLALAGAANRTPRQPQAQQQPACGAAVLASDMESWTPDHGVSADFTLDGKPDVAFWRPDSSGVVLLVAQCDSSAVQRTWRFKVDLPATCDLQHVTVEAAGMLLDHTVVARACGSTPPSSECVYLRRENERRQALMDAGGRQLHVYAPGCAGTRFRWAPDIGGFMKIPG